MAKKRGTATGGPDTFASGAPRSRGGPVRRHSPRAWVAPRQRPSKSGAGDPHHDNLDTRQSARLGKKKEGTVSGRLGIAQARIQTHAKEDFSKQRYLHLKTRKKREKEIAKSKGPISTLPCGRPIDFGGDPGDEKRIKTGLAHVRSSRGPRVRQRKKQKATLAHRGIGPKRPIFWCRRRQESEK